MDCMHPFIRDALVPGIFFWLVGYLAGIVLFFTQYREILGWILIVVFTPFTIAVTWWWFLNRMQPALRYYAGVGIAWSIIAIVLDYVFIVNLFSSAGYYTLHIFLYYGLMFVIPVGVGMFLMWRERDIRSG